MQHIIRLILKYKKVYISVIAVYVSLFVLTAYTIAHKTMGRTWTVNTMHKTPTADTVRQSSVAPAADFPPSFRGTQPNILSYPEALTPLFERMQRGESVRVLQIGDSHVRGNYFPNAVGEVLVRQLGGGLDGIDMDTAPALDGGVSFDYIAQNGAHASRFCEDDYIEEIAVRHPDLVIVSFGTNEAHGAFDSRMHTVTLQMLVDRIRQRCPQALFLFTTPPGSYIVTYGHRWRDRRGRWHYNSSHSPNARTEEVARCIDEFAKTQQHACWNIFEIAGGNQYAAINWRNGGYMQSDCIHYTVEGYALQGRLLGEAIMKAYEQTSGLNP